ncbi:hypothetical protein [Porphyromonas gulae]|nr:hypothetical protein [Porphyromonas gulae]
MRKNFSDERVGVLFWGGGSGEKTPIDFADSEKGFTFAPTVRRMIGSVP